ncbi:hypothetical protein SCLCIDRAFT_125014 [Scleroderma citrinum Foug A]|uniref:Ubiquitin-like protease family profile domain-containing protein n=1 Tax=Scleroderma citrinum Foug A TaxID=1036808 RepID=A0A0C3DW47_9AGAM|nr:hypothetical protein SCLCIDRAFT_125014 [Scleroderma citrinum Foug A]
MKTEPVQSNHYDCGIWVLAQMTAVLRGFDITGLHESDMFMFRHYLRVLIACIPVPGR